MIREAENKRALYALNDLLVTARTMAFEKKTHELRVPSKKFESWRTSLMTSISEDPEAVRRFEAAMSAKEGGRFDEAEQLLRPLLMVYPEDAGILVSRGYVLWELGRLEDAVEKGVRAVEVGPSV